MSTISTDLLTLSANSLAEATTGWTLIGTGTLATDLDVKIQGTACLKSGSITGAAESGVALNAFTALNLSGNSKLIYSWRNQAMPTNLPLKGQYGGAAMWISSGITYNAANNKVFDLDGSDTDKIGGWKSYAVDPNRTSGKTNGTLSTTAITSVGFTRYLLTGTSVALDYVDATRYGSALKLKDNSAITGSAGTFSELYTYDSTISLSYGLLTQDAGVYYAIGKLYIGGSDLTFPTLPDAQGSLTWFKDTDQDLRFKYMPVSSGFYELRVASPTLFSIPTIVQLGEFNPGTIVATNGVFISGTTDNGAMSSTIEYPGLLSKIPMYTLSTTIGVSQSFICDRIGSKLKEAYFYIGRVGAPTGNLTAKLYAHSGTFGTTSLPGTLLATSDLVTNYTTASTTFTSTITTTTTLNVTVASAIPLVIGSSVTGQAQLAAGTIITAFGTGTGGTGTYTIAPAASAINATATTTTALLPSWQKFSFTGANQVTLTDGTAYVLALEYSTGAGSSSATVYYTTFANTGLATTFTPGSSGTLNGATWGGTSANDIPHRLYTINQPANWKLTATNTNGGNIIRLYGSTFNSMHSASLNGNSRSFSLSCAINSTTTVTSSNLFVSNYVVPGMLVNGAGITTGTYVASVESAGSLTLSQAATGTSGSASLTFSDQSEMISCNINASGAVTSNGCKIYDTIFQNTKTEAPIGATNALVVASPAEILKVTSSRFINCNRAVRITTASASANIADEYIFDGLLFSGHNPSAIPPTYDVENTTAGAVYIRLINGSTASTSITTGTPINANALTVGVKYTIVTLGNTNFNTAAGTTGVTYIVGSTFIAANTGNGSGTVTGSVTFRTPRTYTISNVVAGSRVAVVQVTPPITTTGTPATRTVLAEVKNLGGVDQYGNVASQTITTTTGRQTTVTGSGPYTITYEYNYTANTNIQIVILAAGKQDIYYSDTLANTNKSYQA
jgi:hypothetical protein